MAFLFTVFIRLNPVVCSCEQVDRGEYEDEDFLQSQTFTEKALNHNCHHMISTEILYMLRVDDIPPRRSRVGNLAEKSEKFMQVKTKPIWNWLLLRFAAENLLNHFFVGMMFES